MGLKSTGEMTAREYNKAHKAVRRDFGKASARSCEFRCGNQARDWAWMHDEDPWDTTNYMALCVKCHRSYDMTEEWASRLRLNALGHKHSEDAKAKMRAAKIGRNHGMFGDDSPVSKLTTEDVVAIKKHISERRFTQRDLSEIYEVSISTIRNIAQRKSWRHVP